MAQQSQAPTSPPSQSAAIRKEVHRILLECAERFELEAAVDGGEDSAMLDVLHQQLIESNAAVRQTIQEVESALKRIDAL